MKSLRPVLLILVALILLAVIPFLLHSPAEPTHTGDVTGTETASATDTVIPTVTDTQTDPKTDVNTDPETSAKTDTKTDTQTATKTSAKPKTEQTYDYDPTLMDRKVSNGVTLRQYVDRVIEIACSEPSNPVVNGKTKYGELFGAPSAAWCTEFAMYCLKAAEEELGTSFINDVYPWLDSAYRSGLWYKKQNRYQEPSKGYIPYPGDLIFFDTTKKVGYPDHTGYVIKSYNEDGVWYIETIEGNIPGDKVKVIRSRKMKANDATIMAYGSCLVVTPYKGSLTDYND